MSHPTETTSAHYQPQEAAQKLRALLAQVERQMPAAELPAATPPRGPKKLTVGMAAYDEYDGVYFTVQALRMYHPEVLDEVEIIVLDNHPEGPAAAALKNLDTWIPNYRYVPYRAYRSTAVRDLIFRESSADYVLCVDAHVLIEPGAVRRLIDYFDAHPGTSDLLQGPLVYDDLKKIETHFSPVWRSGMFGTWEYDERGREPGGEPFEIPMQGLGLFACRRAAWPGFNPRLRGFGGEEGYIHEKIRRAGGRTLCLPFLRWLHRFGRPTGIPYQPKYEDRIRNYLITHRELGLDEGPVANHFAELLGPDLGERHMARARTELANPFCWFDAVYCISLNEAADRWRQMEGRFERLGIKWLVRHFGAVRTPENHHVGCALSHRGVIAEAKKLGLRNVLVFEDDAVFRGDTLSRLEFALRELERQEWDVFYLGGHKWGRKFKTAPGCQSLEIPDGLTTTHAVAYNHTVYDRLLDRLPGGEEEMAAWLADNYAIDQFLPALGAAGEVRLLLAKPMLSMQPALLESLKPAERKTFTI
jgi:hypothetical protein